MPEVRAALLCSCDAKQSAKQSAEQNGAARSDSHPGEEQRSTVDGRRSTVRHYFPTPTGEVLLWVSADKWIPALTVDVAPGGLAAAVESKSPFQFVEGFQVRVAFKNRKRMAEVTSVTEMDDGQYRNGLKWLDLDE